MQVQEQKAEGEHQRTDEKRPAPGDRDDSQEHWGGPQAADPGRHRADHEDQEAAQPPAANLRGPLHPLKQVDILFPASLRYTHKYFYRQNKYLQTVLKIRPIRKINKYFVFKKFKVIEL